MNIQESMPINQLTINTSIPSGQCLTPENYQDIGIQSFYVRLQDLLVKPGIETLLHMQSVKQWLGFQGMVYLDISLPTNRQGVIKIKSPFDGSIIKPDTKMLQQLLQQIDADIQIDSNQTLNMADNACNDGFEGYFYSEGKRLNTQAPEMKNDHRILAEHCTCPACKQGLTRAYFAHLHIHVPLLSQRFLIQHNVCMAQD